MRTRTWLMLAFIIALAVVSTWISLPGSAFDVAGVRATHPVKEGLDLQGGVQVVLQAKPVAGVVLDRDTLEGTRQTLERRVNGLGVSEPFIQTRGDDQIIVELPGVRDVNEAVNTIQKTALLEIINPNGQFLPEGTVVDTSLGPADRGNGTSLLATPGATPVGGAASATPIAGASPPGPVYETIISGSDLKTAYISTGATGIDQVVAFELQGDAATRFYAFTSEHLGEPMSILIDKTVISSPSIQAPISGQGIIEGIPPDEVDDMVIQLKAGSLGVPLEIVQSRSVGPTLGQDSIDRSIFAGLVGLGIVALFMVLYYRLLGAVAVLALLIYTSIVFAIFKLIPVTLTLAGIAGFILSIGMAVDANVLIFARIKEEVRQGKPLEQAVESGFAHAWPSIRDSNITTMITTFILYVFGSYTGTSIITGFALTLFIGVTVSMFTAITVTRTFLRVLVAVGVTNETLWLGASPAAAPSASVGS